MIWSRPGRPVTAGFPAPQIRYRFLRSRPPRRRPRFPALDLLLSPQISPSRYPLPLWLFSCDSRCGGYVFRSGGRPGACVRRIPSMRRCSAGCIRRSRIKKDGRRLCVRLCPGGLSAACRSLLQADFLAGGRLTCLRRYFRGVLPACWGTGWGAPCSAAPLSGYSSGFGLLSGVEGWFVAPETEQGIPSASTRAPILISSPSGIFSSPCAGVSRSIV